MKRSINSQRGSVAVIFAAVFLALMGFVALGIEAGRFYLVKSELSKAVDAAALVAADNISNPYITLSTLAQEVGFANFPPGQFGTPASGTGSVSFTLTALSSSKMQVVGSVTSPAIFARLLGIQQVATGSSGVAQKNKVEIMLVLDRSGSMDGTPISDLKTAAVSFVNYFTQTQDQDKMGLISFGTGVTVNYALNTNFVSGITSAINGMSATGATNAEDAIDQSDGPSGFTNQAGIPGDQRVQQYMIFFTDGRPTAFSSTFGYNGQSNIPAVPTVSGNCDQNPNQLWTNLGNTGSEAWIPTSTLPPTPTGDGNKTSGLPLTSCTNSGTRYLNTRWDIFSDATYGITNPNQCRSTTSALSFLGNYVCTTARAMAIAKATVLKNNGIKIYTIGEGSSIDTSFLDQIASGSQYEYVAPNSSTLQTLFNAIAKEIKLRLVQ